MRDGAPWTRSPESWMPCSGSAERSAWAGCGPGSLSAITSRGVTSWPYSAGSPTATTPWGWAPASARSPMVTTSCGPDPRRRSAPSRPFGRDRIRHAAAASMRSGRHPGVGDQSTIEWTDATWNPVTGCTKISQGCKFCYAERLARRLQAMGQDRYRNGFAVTLHPDAVELPLRWSRPRTIFVNSMSDLFHQRVPSAYIRRVFDVMREARSEERRVGKEC